MNTDQLPGGSAVGPLFFWDGLAAAGFFAGDAGVFAAGFVPSVCVDELPGVAFGSGVGLTGMFDSGTRGVGVGFTGVSAFAGIGTRITPPSLGMNWLPPFGSIVTVCPGGGIYTGIRSPVGIVDPYDEPEFNGAPAGGTPPLAQAL